MHCNFQHPPRSGRPRSFIASRGGSSKGYWRVAGSKVLQVSLPNSYWNRLGLKTLSQVPGSYVMRLT